MVVYIITYCLSLFFMNIAIKTESKVTSLFTHFLALTPPIFLLTFRAEECGTDTINYIKIFNRYSVYSISDFLNETRLEMLFAFLQFFIKKLGLTIEYLFCISAILTVVPIYIGSIRLRKKISPLLPMALFYLMFYQYAFNIVRQSIAMSLLFLAVVYLIEHKKKLSFILGITATFFHTVALIYFIVYILFELLENHKRKYLMLNVLALLISLYLFQFFYVDKIEYLEGYLVEKGVTQNSYLVEMIINIIVVLLWKKDSSNLRKYFFIVSSIGLLLCLFSTGGYAFRIANCIDILLLLYIPMALKCINQKVITASYFSFAFFFWWFVFIYNNSGKTYPYILSSSVSLF